MRPSARRMAMMREAKANPERTASILPVSPSALNLSTKNSDMPYRTVAMAAQSNHLVPFVEQPPGKQRHVERRGVLQQDRVARGGELGGRDKRVTVAA